MDSMMSILGTGELPLSSHAIAGEAAVAESARRRRASEQRAMIRATARAVLAECGYTGFHVGDLAARCEVAVQTLYNHLGGRDDILSSAIDELFKAQLTWCQRESARTRTNFILVCCDLTATLMEVDEKYIVALIAILKDQRQPLADMIAARCAAAYRAHLQRLRDADVLKSWVSIDTLATALQDIVLAILMVRVGCPSDASRLRHELLMSVGLLLHGATRGDEAERIEATLDATLGKRLGNDTPRKTFSDAAE